VLNGIPKRLTPRIINQIQQLEYDYPQLCLLNLATAALAYRPLHMLEIDFLAEEIPDLEDLERIINMCGSFLTSFLPGVGESTMICPYSLQDPGSTMKDIPDPDPLASIRYSCVFWVNHLCNADDQSSDRREKLSDDGQVFAVLKEHLLHWLGSLSLIYKLSDGVLSIRKLLQKSRGMSDTTYNHFLILSDNSLNLLLQVLSL
jgi:hypothetical protein